jgi:hypothetical protein
MAKLKFISQTISQIPCSNCGGDVQEFSVPNVVWNNIVRRGSGEADNEYLCVWCFVAEVVEWYSHLTRRAADERHAYKNDICVFCGEGLESKDLPCPARR